MGTVTNSPIYGSRTRQQACYVFMSLVQIIKGHLIWTDDFQAVNASASGFSLSLAHLKNPTSINYYLQSWNDIMEGAIDRGQSSSSGSTTVFLSVLGVFWGLGASDFSPTNFINIWLIPGLITNVLFDYSYSISRPTDANSGRTAKCLWWPRSPSAF